MGGRDQVLRLARKVPVQASFVWTGNDRVQVGMDDRVDVKHLQDRFTGLGVSYRIHGVVIDERLAAGVTPVCASFNSSAVTCDRYHSAPFAWTLTLPKVPLARTAITFATGRSAGAVHQVVSFTRCRKGVDPESHPDLRDSACCCRRSSRRKLCHLRVPFRLREHPQNESQVDRRGRLVRRFVKLFCRQSPLFGADNRPALCPAATNVAGDNAFRRIYRHNITLP